MQINEDIKVMLKAFNINENQGLLYLLAVHFSLDADGIIPEEVIKAVALTKIVEKDFKVLVKRQPTIKWNMPLFIGQQTAFDWVKNWNEQFGRINPARQSSWEEATNLMREFFAKYPEYRKEDVIKATNSYFSTVKDGQYLITSAKFIFEGKGATRKSDLLGWCQKIVDSNRDIYARGTIL
jgi:hypothetical protein